MSFIYKGISSTDMGFNVTERVVYTAPAFDVNAIEVPGRSGDVLNPQNRYKNKAVTYKGFLRERDFEGATKWERLSAGTRALKAWLLSDAGVYNDLTDDYDPGFLRRAYIDGETAITCILDRPLGAELTVRFIAEPFMFGPEAEDITLNAAGTVENPNLFASQPLYAITMSWAGSLTVGNKTWQIGSHSGTLYCDCRAMDWYDAGALKNNIVTGSGFPVLEPGTNNISFEGGISQVVVTPRWRTL